MTTIKKKCQIIMLSTDKKAISNEFIIGKRVKANTEKPINELVYGFALSNIIFQRQHLYILSDDEIKEGDYVLIQLSEINIIEIQKVKNYNNENFIFDNNNQIYKDYCKKIIATTDTSLELPQLPKEFIETYILSYNMGSMNTITEIMVEYEIDGPYMGYFGDINCSDYTLKINESNEVLVSLVKNNWNREEVIDLLNRVLISTGVTIQAEIRCSLTGSAPNFKLSYNGIDLKKWIEQNLQ